MATEDRMPSIYQLLIRFLKSLSLGDEVNVLHVVSDYCLANVYLDHNCDRCGSVKAKHYKLENNLTYWKCPSCKKTYAGLSVDQLWLDNTTRSEFIKFIEDQVKQEEIEHERQIG